MCSSNNIGRDWIGPRTRDLFRPVTVDGSRVAREQGRLQTNLRRTGIPTPDANAQYTMHSFRVEGAVSHSLADTVVADIMSLVGLNCAGVHIYVRSSEVYRGYILHPHHGGKRKHESHEQTYMDANELPTLPEFAKQTPLFRGGGGAVLYLGKGIHTSTAGHDEVLVVSSNLTFMLRY